MEWKFEGNLLPLPFVLHLQSQNCFSPDVPEEEKEKTVKDIPVTRRSRLGWIVAAVVLVALAVTTIGLWGLLPQWARRMHGRGGSDS